MSVAIGTTAIAIKLVESFISLFISNSTDSTLLLFPVLRIVARFAAV
jgi:hypothetical protein